MGPTCCKSLFCNTHLHNLPTLWPYRACTDRQLKEGDLVLVDMGCE